MLTLAVIYQGYILYPYLLPVSPVVPDRTVTNEDRTFRLLTANVLMENREIAPYFQLIETHDPDIILVMEADKWWTEQLVSLHEEYPHHVEQPQSNHYGMNLYSRFPLTDTAVHYFEHTETPSIQTVLQLPGGDEVIFFGTHPRPPLPENSVDAADKELIKIAQLARAVDRPVIVAGDFNDVPWSFTVEKFQEISRLRDIRVGRGLYNTFDAKHPLLRLPIDHIFLSPGLGLVNMEKPITFSSDHMALFVQVVVDESVD